jgi:multidrug efflux pump subunit AcrA (membrane-fusion protein)
VERLAEAQARTEERVTRLEEAVARLAEAQARTEERVTRLEEAVARLETAVERLAEAQARTEERVTRLEEAVARLAEAQARTEERVTRLEEAVARLAEAQARTEERVVRVEVTLRELAQQVGRLSDTIGFGLEDIARVVLPGWLSRHEGIEVEELTRTFFEVDGEVVEINLYGVGVRGGEKVAVLGEARSRIYEHDVKEFDGVAEKAGRVIPHRVYKLLFGYWIHPAAQREAAGRGLTLIASYMR